MARLAKILILLLLLNALSSNIFPQKKPAVRVNANILAEKFPKQCKQIVMGKLLFFLEPEYPVQALSNQAEQKVNITINVNEKGFFLGIISVDGKSPFLETAIRASQKVKFSPTLCNGRPISVPVVLNYTFLPGLVSQTYFSPQKVEEFADVKKESKYYEPIFYLTENYKISFGYADNKFHEEAFLTRGDFYHFLRLTLDLLVERARFANKDPNTIKLIRPFDPNKLISKNEIKDLDPKLPSTDSVLVLIDKYKIVLVNQNFELRSLSHISQNEVIGIWSNIFGIEALPIHFKKKTDENDLITRGEFALFLQESLRVLTYKVMP